MTDADTTIRRQLKRAVEKGAGPELCSYCGKSRREVRALVISERPPCPCICDECVSLCLDLMRGDMSGPALREAVRRFSIEDDL